MKNLLAIPFLFVVFSAASQTISTEAPSVSASAVTVPKNSFQIESGLTFGVDRTNLPNQDYTFGMPTALFRYGLFNKFELRATGAFTISHNNSSLGNPIYNFTDVGIGAKYELLNKPEGKTQMAVIAHFNFWNQDNPFKSTFFDYALNHNFNGKHSLGFNAGVRLDWQHFGNTNIGIRTYRSSLIYNFCMNEKITLFGELYGATSQWVQKGSGFEYKSDFEESYGANVGILYLLRDNIQIDFLMGRIVNSKRFNASLGFNILLNSK